MPRLPSRRRCLLLGGLLLMPALVSGCGGGDDRPGSSAAERSAKLPVVAAFSPLEEAAKAIGGDRVKVTDLTPVGGQPYGLEPAPPALKALEQSKLVLFLGQGFQPAVAGAVAKLPAEVEAVDLLDGQQLRPVDRGIPGTRGEVEGGADEALDGGKDPHVWVDPARFAAMAERVRDALIAADPDGRAAYEANASAYLDRLRALDADFATGLKDCRSTVLLTTHAAFGYLAEHYGLTQAALAGISPGDTPDPQSLAAAAKYAKAKGVTTLFFETPPPAALSDTIAKRVGARTDVLNALKGLTTDQLAAGASYESLQRQNLRRLAQGLGCPAAGGG